MEYSTQTFDWITRERTNIEQVAQTLGVSATAIAGAMAKEQTLTPKCLEERNVG